MQPHHKLMAACLSALALTLSLRTAPAATITNADTSATLNLGTAWVGGVVPGSANVVVWDNNVQVNLSKTLGASAAWAGIQELNPGGPVVIGADGSTLTLGASGIDLSQATTGLTLNNLVSLGAAQTWNVAGGQTLTLGGVVSGSSPLTLNSGGTTTGTIILNGADTYTGGTLINSGIVVPGVAASFGTAGVTNNTGTILLSTLASGGIIANTFTIKGNTLLDLNNRGVSQVLDGAFSGTGTIYVTNLTSSAATLTLGGNGNGGGSFNAFTGSLIVVSNASGTASAGTIRFNNGGGSPNLGNAGMILDLGNGSVHFTEKNSGQTTTFGALYGGNNTQLAQPENYVIGALNLNTLFAGTITGAASSLTKNGTGTLTLTGNNANTGTTTVNAGALQIGDGVTIGQGALGTGAITINANGTLIYNKPDAFTVNNNISGAGALIQLNASTFTYGGTDSASGTLTVSGGTLALGSSGAINSPVALASGTTYDVSANTAFTLTSSLSGSGTVNGLLTTAGGTLNPGGTAAAGTLTFASGLNENGNVNNQFELSSPTGTNDLINITGDLTLTGTNNILLGHFGGGNIPNGTYPLVNFSGNFNGNLSQLAVTVAGVKGTLNLLSHQLTVTISPNIRGSLPLTWVGDGAANDWDLVSSNWVNGATHYNFLAGDSAIFNNTGLPNSNVTVVTLVAPASVLFNGTGNYVLAGNYGVADSSTPSSLTLTNSGTLAIYATNTYTGPTVVGGGTLAVYNLANGGSPSAIGAALSNPTNLVFYGSTLAYDGPSAATDRGATLLGTGATFDITNGVDLTENGTLTGPGALTVVDTGTLTFSGANTYTGGTVVSNATLAAATQLANVSAFGPTNSPITLLGGTLILQNSTHDDGATFVYSFFNPLIVPAGQTGYLNVFQRGDENGALTGGGVLNISSLGARAGFAGNWSAFTGTLNITGTFRIANTYGYTNAVIYLNTGADLDGGSSGGAYSSNPTFNIGELDGVGTVGATSKPTPYPIWQVGWLNTTSVFAGTIQDAAGGQSSISKVGTGTWYLSGVNTYSGTTTINAGVLALTNNVNTGADGSIANSTNIFINTGAALDLSGTLNDSDTFFLGASQVLSGYGTLRGLLDTTSGGTVTGGGGLAGGVGVLTVTNSINLGGVAWLKLNRASSPNSDRLVSSTAGLINYGGTLLLTNVGPRLQVGDSFTLFGARMLTGSFSSVVLPNYYTFNTSQLAVSGRVSVTGVSPAPAITSVDSSQLANGTLTLHSTGGVANGAVTVLATTNLALPLASWTTAATGNFDASGNLSQPVTVDPALPQQYFLLQSY